MNHIAINTSTPSVALTVHNRRPPTDRNKSSAIQAYLVGNELFDAVAQGQHVKSFSSLDLLAQP